MIYPLGGLGVSVVKDAPQNDGSIQIGLSVPGVFTVVGFYAKYTLNQYPKIYY